MRSRLPVDTFSNGKRQVVPFGIAFLLVRRYGIVDDCLNSLLQKVFLQQVPFVGEDWEDVEDIVSEFAIGEGNGFVVYVLIVVAGDIFPSFVFLIQVFEFHAQHGSLYFVHSAVPTYIGEYIFP